MGDTLLVKQALPERTVQNSRLFAFGQQQLWNAIANPDQLKQWWGPNGFTNTFNEFDFQEGGYWRFIMHGPDGKNYDNESQFVQLQAPSFVCFDHISPPKFQIQISLDKVGEEHTELTFKMVFDTEKERDNLVDFVKDKNEENLDRLQNLLLTTYAV